MGIRQIIPSFNAGELSPLVSSRVDTEKYGSGCRLLENFIIMPYGGVNRRPGMQYMFPAKSDTSKTRLIGFNFSRTTNFILEFSHLKIRFFSNDVVVPLELDSPYAQGDLFDLQYAQINDVMYIVHPDHPPHKLSRFADDDWRLEKIVWDYPAFLDRKEDAITLTPSGTTGTITVTASEDLFHAEHVGAFFEVGHRRNKAVIEVAINGNKTSGTMRVVGGWDLITTGTWDADIFIESSFDDGDTWEVTRTLISNMDRNFSTAGNQVGESLMRVRIVNWNPADSQVPPRIYLTAVEAVQYGVIEITSVTDEKNVDATVIKPLQNNTSTKIWREGAWSEYQGFPRTVCLHSQRLFFGGTDRNAQTVWGSEVNNFETFRFSSMDDSAISFTVASSEQNAINWLVSHGSLLIGTRGDEYIMRASEENAVITPTNIQVERQSRWGSMYMPAILINDTVLFVQRQGRKVREFTYNFERDGWVAPDMTLLAEHLTAGGIIQTAFQQQPDSILWCVTAKNKLIGMTYERDQNVVGWHRHETQGEIESIASIYGEDGSDELWCVVVRDVNGEKKRYIEKFHTGFRNALDAENKLGWVYLDSAIIKTEETPFTKVTGLEHLEGCEVGILADGAEYDNRTVDNGEITLEHEASHVVVGLPYVSTLQPMPLEFPTQTGTAQGKTFRVHKLGVRLHKSLGGEVLTGSEQWDELPMRDTANLMGESPPPFSGQLSISIASKFASKGEIAIRQRAPMPLTILALLPLSDVYGE